MFYQFNQFTYLYLLSLILLPLTIIKFKFRKKVLVILTILLLLFCGFRFRSGDYEMYKFFYIVAPKLSDFFTVDLSYLDIEVGYVLLMSFLKSIGFDEYGYFFITSSVLILSVYRASNKYVKNSLISMIIFFYLYFISFSFVLIRQGLSIGILLFSYKFIFKREKYYFLISVLVASLFHKSALIFILAYFLPKLKITKKTFILSIFFIAILMIFTNTQILVPIVNKLPNFIPKHKFLKYILQNGRYGKFEIGFGSVEKIFLVGIGIFFRKQLNSKVRYRFFYNQYLLSVIIYFSFFRYNVIAGRMGDVFSISIIFIIPIYYEIIKKYRKKELTSLFFLAMIYFSLRGYLNFSAQFNVFKYQNIFF